MWACLERDSLNFLARGGGGGAVTTLSKPLILNVDHTNNRDPVEVVGRVEGEEVGE